MIKHTQSYLSAFLPLLLLLTAVVNVSAQDKLKFSIESFEADLFDSSAKDKYYQKTDYSGDLYAIIKVTSTNANDNLKEYNFNFGNMNHLIEEHDGVLWIYVQKNAKIVTITRDGYAPINRYDLHTTIESGKNYTMVLSSQPKKIQRQMTQFNVTPSDSRAMITIKNSFDGSREELFGVVSETGSIAKNLPFGTYSYKVISDSYQTVEGLFTLNNRINTHIENVTLTPNYSRVALKVGSNAEIYVNDELMGVGEWTGNLKAGDYQVECRQENHTSTFEFIHVNDNEDMAITLKSPQKRMGMASVISSPLGATIRIDGRNYGMTPQNVELPLGLHLVELSLEGYKTGKMRIDIAENETSEINMQLSDIANATHAENPYIYSLKDQNIEFKDGIPLVMDVTIDEYGYMTRAADYRWPDNAIIVMNCMDDQNLADSGTSLYARYTIRDGWMLYNFNKKEITGVSLKNVVYDENISAYNIDENTSSFSDKYKAIYADRTNVEGNWDGVQSVASYRGGKFYLTATLQPTISRIRFVSDKKPSPVNIMKTHDFEGNSQNIQINWNGMPTTSNLASPLNFRKESDGQYYSEYLYTDKYPDLRIKQNLYKNSETPDLSRARSLTIPLPSNNKSSDSWSIEKYNRKVQTTSYKGENSEYQKVIQLFSDQIIYVDLLNLLKSSDLHRLYEASHEKFESSFGMSVIVDYAIVLDEETASGSNRPSVTLLLNGAYDKQQNSELYANSNSSMITHASSASDRIALRLTNESNTPFSYYPYLKISCEDMSRGRLIIKNVYISNFD